MKENYATFLRNLKFVCLYFDFSQFFSKVIQITSFQGIAGEILVSTEREAAKIPDHNTVES